MKKFISYEKPEIDAVVFDEVMTGVIVSEITEGIEDGGNV